MKRGLIALLVVGLGWTQTAMTYTRSRFQIGVEVKAPRWSTAAPIPFVVNVDTPNSIVAGSKPLLAVRNMFENRSAYAAIRFSTTQGSAPADHGLDGVNLVTFKDTTRNRSVSSGFAALSTYWYAVVNDEPVVFESDIVFSPQFTHTTTGVGNSDIEDLGNHEVGHLLSLEHSGVLGSTAYPTLYNQAQFGRRSLALDDVAGSEFLYPFPDTAARTGVLSGTVRKGGTTSVFGAHVVAVRQSDGSVVSDVSVTGGAWRIDALPPGNYTVYAEPYDGPYFPSMISNGIYATNTFDTSFTTRYAGGDTTPTVFAVTAGGSVSGIEVAPVATVSPLNPRYHGRSASTSLPNLSNQPMAVAQGATILLTVGGPGIAAVPNNGVSITGPGVTVSSSGVVRGTLSGIPYMIVSVTVAPDAAPGVRSIVARDGTRIGTISGAFEVTPSSAMPGLLRSDEVTALAPVSPPLSSIFPLDSLGPDAFPGIGEGIDRPVPGSDDDDDLYLPEVPSGYLDPDVSVAADASRPLVFYTLTTAGSTLRVNRTPSGRIQIVY